MFREAQQSIMDLNHSRLAALEELQLARSRIAELEERLETAEAVAQDATAEVAEVLAAEAALPEAEDEEEPAAAAAVAGAIVLKYPTSWSPAFIHYKVEGGEWDRMTIWGSLESGLRSFGDFSHPAVYE